ncbi:hypothetical protein CEXT_806931 [Caerostris extrusa]|uniref:Uncharacterized protein n=1 Tax=Caerostris extrusa TaxID=172846 RepID=A0AAV4PBF9_CAEEX|nr:hypothetical protein CEXT_806931 [Caerostris extrusa]
MEVHSSIQIYHGHNQHKHMSFRFGIANWFEAPSDHKLSLLFTRSNGIVHFGGTRSLCQVQLQCVEKGDGEGLTVRSASVDRERELPRERAKKAARTAQRPPATNHAGTRTEHAHRNTCPLAASGKG